MTNTENRYGPRPALGELTEGQEVMVYRAANDRRRLGLTESAIPARIVKANRVWIEIEEAGPALRSRRRRMRRDTQSEGTQYPGSNASFVTLEQHEWGKVRTWAFIFLREQGIDIRYGGPWEGREVELADIIAAALKGEQQQ